ncbi:RDD family protein [Aeromicrobium sp. IC_218]|uniref:RDD family protein n=1 Tax=Aeromicrobium sp. IC_218 TaxID=2545468 RepID=UPI001040A72F|nr:RDD family protein [Aeromicrobium sp. IC_218]TCI97640.1 RDD family protein [Aeromicrobium sp. IC_218]
MSARPPVGHVPMVPTEARPHQGREAGVVSRLLAATIDLALVVLVLVSVYLAWAGLRFVLDSRGFHLPRPSTGLVGLSYVAVAVVSLSVPWCLRGRSYGQHVMGLRVTTLDGGRLGLARAAARALLCVLVPVGLLWVAVSRRDAAWHDLVLRTSVRYDWATWT